MKKYILFFALINISAINCMDEKEAQEIALTQKMIQARADLDVVTDDGDTPLMLAIRNGKPSLAEFLIQQRANVEIINKNGETALSLAEDYEKGTISVANLIKKEIENKRKRSIHQKSIKRLIQKMSKGEYTDNC